MSEDRTTQLVLNTSREVGTNWPVTPENLPQALGSAAITLSQLAREMRADDISLNVDVVGGILSFRAYRRDRR